MISSSWHSLLTYLHILHVIKYRKRPKWLSIHTFCSRERNRNFLPAINTMTEPSYHYFGITSMRKADAPDNKPYRMNNCEYSVIKTELTKNNIIIMMMMVVIMYRIERKSTVSPMSNGPFNYVDNIFCNENIRPAVHDLSIYRNCTLGNIRGYFDRSHAHEVATKYPQSTLNGTPTCSYQSCTVLCRSE